MSLHSVRWRPAGLDEASGRTPGMPDCYGFAPPHLGQHLLPIERSAVPFGRAGAHIDHGGVTAVDQHVPSPRSRRRRHLMMASVTRKPASKPIQRDQEDNQSIENFSHPGLSGTAIACTAAEAIVV